ncbi:MAG: hypothetical protein AABY26_02905 [Nanoarchaeota archaeon]
MAKELTKSTIEKILWIQDPDGRLSTESYRDTLQERYANLVIDTYQNAEDAMSILNDVEEGERAPYLVVTDVRITPGEGYPVDFDEFTSYEGVAGDLAQRIKFHHPEVPVVAIGTWDRRRPHPALFPSDYVKDVSAFVNLSDTNIEDFVVVMDRYLK